MANIVFDLDGTLIHSAPGIATAANRALADLGKPPLTLDHITSFIGNGVPVLITKLANASGLDPVHEQPLLSAFRRHYDADPAGASHLFDGVRDALEQLLDQGAQLAICTNKPETPTFGILEALSLRPYFKAVIGGDTLPQRKPDPAPLRRAFDQLGGPGLYVGDSEVDAATAQAADIPFVLFTEGYRQTPAEQLPHHATFSDYANLPDLLAQLG